MKRNSILVVVVLAVLALFAGGAFFYQNKQGQERTEVAAKSSASLVQFHSPSTGASDAKVTIVEFLDRSCEACRAFYPYVKSILAENPGKVRLVVRYAAFHQDSDAAVKILEAARVQGLFWQTLEAAFDSQPVWADHGNPQIDRLWEFLPRAGLDIKKAKIDMENPRIMAILQQDMADIQTLQVKKTPTFFVNGKPLLVSDPQALRALVQQEVKASY